MQNACKRAMETTQPNIFWYFSRHKGGNSIDSKAACHISKAMWRSVDSLNLSIFITIKVENQIDDRGCKYLTKANMNKLTYLSLCTVFERKGKIL